MNLFHLHFDCLCFSDLRLWLWLFIADHLFIAKCVAVSVTDFEEQLWELYSFVSHPVVMQFFNRAIFASASKLAVFLAFFMLYRKFL